MVYKKAQKLYGKCYPRKDYRASELGLKYKMWFHYSNGHNAKKYRKRANQKLRRYKGDVGNNGWYKRFEEVWYLVF